MANSITIDQSNEQRLMDQAKEFGERQRRQESSGSPEALEGTKRRAREFTQRTGVHVSGENTAPHTRHLVSHTIDETVGKGQIKIGNVITTPEAARASGFIDDAGELTERGQTLAGRGGSEGPSQAAQPQEAEADPQSERREEAAEEQRQTAGEQDAEASAEAADVLSDVHTAFADGDLETVAEAAEAAIEGLRGSEAYGAALDAYLRDGAVPDAETAQAIASDLGISPGDADALVDVVITGFASEARQAAEPIVGAENVDAFADWARLVPGRVRAAVTHQVRGGSLGGWQQAAREFRAAVAQFDGMNFDADVGQYPDGMTIWKDENTGKYLAHVHGKTLDLRAALATGLVEPIE